MSDLIDELKEDLTREKYALIWQKYGNFLIGAAIAALVITGAAVAFKNHLNTQYEAYSDALYEADSATEADALKKYDEIIANANGTYKAIAGLRKAAIMLQTSKNKEALEIYGKIIEESGSPQELAGVAKLLYIAVSSNLALENKDFNDESAKKYLQENIADGGIFKYSAMEINAFQELRAHNYTKAKDIFNTLEKALDAPQNVKIRAREMLDAIANINGAEPENVTEKKNG